MIAAVFVWGPKCHFWISWVEPRISYAPLYQDDETAGLVARLAERLKTTKQDAVKTVVREKLESLSSPQSFEKRLRDFYARHPLPATTGLVADKALFDDLTGETS